MKKNIFKNIFGAISCVSLALGGLVILASCDEETDTTHTHEFSGAYLSDSTGHWQVCSCGEKGEVSAHTFGQYTVVKAATEDAAGTEERTCSVCSYLDSKEIAKLAHTHTFGSWSVKTTPTATTKGELERVCSKDKTHTETFELPVLNETDYTVTTVDATCTTKGSKTYKYTKDEEVLTVATVDIDALGHSFGEWSVKTEPTATTKGELERVCSKDENHKETFELPVLNETDYTVTTVDATYEAKGSITYEYTKDSQTIVVATTDIAKLTYKLPAGITSESFDNAEAVYYYQNASNVIHESKEKPAASYYNGKFYDSLGSALYASRLNTEDEEVVIYMNPNSTSECGGYFGTILENVTIYGNGATVAESDRLAIEDSDSNLLTTNITINIYDLNNAVVWGTRKTTYTVNINAFNTDFDRININNPSSICDVNINLSKCKFIGEVQNENLNSSIYFNTTLLTQCNGTITLDGCEFENSAVGLNLNHKMAGSQVVTITNTTFKDVAVSKVSTDGEEAYFAAIRMYQKVEGATATLNVSGCTFTYSEGKTSVNNYDILLNKIHKEKEAQGTITYKVVGDALIYTGENVTEIEE